MDFLEDRQVLVSKQALLRDGVGDSLHRAQPLLLLHLLLLLLLHLLLLLLLHLLLPLLLPQLSSILLHQVQFLPSFFTLSGCLVPP